VSVPLFVELCAGSAAVRVAYQSDTAVLHNGDCLHVLPTLPDASVDLILTDPPYFRAKALDWDRQWATADAFLEWLGRVADELRRVLKPNGSLYLFASTAMAARVEVLLSERFAVLNRITWAKPPHATKAEMFEKAAMRGYFPVSEAILFCEQQGADSMAMGDSGYAAKCEHLRGFVFEPLRAYLDGERERAGWTVRHVAEEYQKKTGSRTVTGMAGHWFGSVQWALPTTGNLDWLRSLFNSSGGEYLRREYEDLRREYEDLRREYEDLRREYEDLRREYEDLRRPFTVTADVSYTDVWTFGTVGAYPGKHPCEKPLDLLTHAICASSRPGGVVLDAFAGGGSCARAALLSGRRWIGIERDPKWCAAAAAVCARPERAQVKRAAVDPAQGRLL